MSKKIYLVCYTEAGEQTMRRAERALQIPGRQTFCLVKPKGGGFLSECWQEASAIVFVGAAGIAVRLCAPYIRDKFQDPAVVVMDERSSYVIPLLSGHAGGANELACFLARQMDALPVITTATDVNGCFAVDVFAVKNHLILPDRKRAKLFSAGLLEGKTAGFFCEGPVTGRLPRQLEQTKTRKDLTRFPQALLIAERPENPHPEQRILSLYPRHLTVGMGCRKGISKEKLEQFLLRQLSRLGYHIRQVKRLASIDKKAEEPGLHALAEGLGIPFVTWPAGELEKVDGKFHESAFVSRIMGIGNVCERAAVLGSRGGRLVLEKTAREGMTLAIAAEDWSVNFDESICDRPGTGPV